MKNSRGKVVSRKSHAAGKRTYALNLRGFVAINGKSPQGKALYAKAKSFLPSRVER